MKELFFESYRLMVAHTVSNASDVCTLIKNDCKLIHPAKMTFLSSAAVRDSKRNDDFKCIFNKWKKYNNVPNWNKIIKTHLITLPIKLSNIKCDKTYSWHLTRCVPQTCDISNKCIQIHGAGDDDDDDF